MPQLSELICEDGGPSVAALVAGERDVAALVAEGLSNAEIAERLGLTGDEVGDHLDRAMRALRLATRLRLAVWAAEHGLRGEPVGPC